MASIVTTEETLPSQELTDGQDGILRRAFVGEYTFETGGYLPQIELAYDDHLIFWSTDRGTAQDAYFALHGAKSREPNGWALDFLRAWDASATP